PLRPRGCGGKWRYCRAAEADDGREPEGHRLMATQQWILGLDVGTTGCKAVLFHPSVGIAGVASVPHTMDNPRPGWWEQEADVWWEGTRQAIRAVLAEAGVTGDHVAAVGVSGFGANMVPLDGAGRPLRKAIM